MSDAMVTARMSESKKKAGTRELKKLGMSASQAINQMFDYLIQNKELPFGAKDERPSHAYSKEEIAEAVAWVDSLSPLPANNRFANMTDDEIRYERLASRGHFDGWSKQ